MLISLMTCKATGSPDRYSSSTQPIYEIVWYCLICTVSYLILRLISFFNRLSNSIYKNQFLTPVQFDVLARFHPNPIEIIIEMKKAYLQIAVAKSRRHFLRFLRIDNNFKEIPEIVKFRFWRDCVGINCHEVS